MITINKNIFYSHFKNSKVDRSHLKIFVSQIPREVFLPV